MKRIVFLTPPDARYGFGMARAGQRITEKNEVGAVLEEVAADAEVGLIILDERLYRGIDQEMLAQFEKRASCLLIILPAPAEGERLAADYALDLISRAIGYQVRL